MKINELLRIIGEKIREVRKGQKISQERLAELSNLHPTYISNVENGKVNASIFSYYQIARALNVPLSELVIIAIGKGTDRKIEAEITDLFGKVRSLDRKNKSIFLSAARGLITGIEKT